MTKFKRRRLTSGGVQSVLPGSHRVAHYARGTVFWYAWRGGPLLWSGSLDDEAAAAPAIARAYYQAHDARPAPKTAARLIDDYRRKRLPELRPSTQALYERFLREIEARMGHMSYGELGGRAGRAALRAWREEVSPRTGDNAKTVLAALCTFGRIEDVLPSTCRPTADMPDRYAAPPQPAWTHSEIALARAKLRPKLARVVGLALLTGLRRGDLVRITWSAIDERAGVMRWMTSKGRRFRREAIIDLTPELRAELAQCARSDAVTILTNERGLPWTASGLSNSLDAALAPLGIAKGLHGLRRACATYLHDQGMSEAQIARRLGWSEAEVRRMLATYVDEEARFG